MAFLSQRETRAVSYLQKSLTLREARASFTGKRVFLSHSSKDDDDVAGAIRLLERFRASVYADNFDTSLARTSGLEAARILRGRIRECPRFVVLVTRNSRESRWIPWELGVADG